VRAYVCVCVCACDTKSHEYHTFAPSHASNTHITLQEYEDCDRTDRTSGTSYVSFGHPTDEVIYTAAKLNDPLSPAYPACHAKSNDPTLSAFLAANTHAHTHTHIHTHTQTDTDTDTDTDTHTDTHIHTHTHTHTYKHIQRWGRGSG
jgi:hypothetical protein